MARAETGQAPDLKSYLTGFALAGVLTAVPFCLVAWGLLPRQAALLVIAVAALLQVGVHLRFFLHLGRSTAPRAWAKYQLWAVASRLRSSSPPRARGCSTIAPGLKGDCSLKR